MAGLKRTTTTTGGIFVGTFVAALVLLADLAASFADSDGQFVEHFSSASQRAKDIAGSLFLIVAALAFVLFAQIVASAVSEAELGKTLLVRVAAMFSGVGMLVAALAFLTVPASISLADFFDEGAGGAFGESQAVLPQFGYIVLVVGAMVPAALTIVAIVLLRSLPTWLNRLSYFVAVLLALTSGMVASMILLPIWVMMVALTAEPAGEHAD